MLKLVEVMSILRRSVASFSLNFPCRISSNSWKKVERRVWMGGWLVVVVDRDPADANKRGGPVSQPEARRSFLLSPHT